MTTYYLQNQMITKLSEQSTMEEQINLSPQKKYTASGSDYFQQSIGLASGVLTTFPFQKFTNFDYVVVENTGATSVVLSSYSLVGTVTDVEIATSASGELKAGATSMNRTNYAYKISFNTSDENDIRNILTPIARACGHERPRHPLAVQFIPSGVATSKGPFFLIDAQVDSNAWEFDMFANSNINLIAASGYTLQVYLPTSQILLTGQSTVIPGGDAFQSLPAAVDIQSLGAAGFPNTSGTTNPGGEIKLTGVQA